MTSRLGSNARWNCIDLATSCAAQYKAQCKDESRPKRLVLAATGGASWPTLRPNDDVMLAGNWQPLVCFAIVPANAHLTQIPMDWPIYMRHSFCAAIPNAFNMYTLRNSAMLADWSRCTQAKALSKARVARFERLAWLQVALSRRLQVATRAQTNVQVFELARHSRELPIRAAQKQIRARKI